jgi:hypothetical protein
MVHTLIIMIIVVEPYRDIDRLAHTLAHTFISYCVVLQVFLMDTNVNNLSSFFHASVIFHAS